MSSDSKSNTNPQQLYNDLSNEVADILLGPNSPVRGSAEFDRLISEHDQLLSRQEELKDLEKKLTEVLPGLEQTEGNLTAAQKQLAAEKKKLAAYAGELGQAAFAGLRSGELPDHQIFSDRKELQSRIEYLQRQRSELTADENAGMMDKAKIQAQQLKLKGQIKLEELKINSVDRALGEAILRSKEKLVVECDETKDVLKAIADQRQHVVSARDKVKRDQEIVTPRKSEAAKLLERSSVENATALNDELRTVRKEAERSAKRAHDIRGSVVETALKEADIPGNGVVRQKLEELRQLTPTSESKWSEWKKLPEQLLAQFTLLSPQYRYGIVGIFGIVLLTVVVSFRGNDPGGVDAVNTTSTLSENVQAEVLSTIESGNPQNPAAKRESVKSSAINEPRWSRPTELYQQMLSLDRQAKDGIRHIEFTIVERLKADRYHIMITRQAPATANWQIPAILLTSRIEYTSKGKSNLRVTTRGTERLQMADGFDKEFQILEEAPGVTWDEFATRFDLLHDEAKELRQQLVVSLLHQHPVKPEKLSALELITGKRKKKSPFAPLGLESDFSSTAVGVMCVDEVKRAATKAEYAWQQGFTPLEFAACQHDTKLLDWLITVGEGPIRAGNEEQRLIEIATEKNLKSGNSFFIYGKDLKGISEAIRGHAK